MFNYSAIYSIIAFRLKEFFSEYQYSLLAPITTNILLIEIKMNKVLIFKR